MVSEFLFCEQPVLDIVCRLLLEKKKTLIGELRNLFARRTLSIACRFCRPTLAGDRRDGDVRIVVLHDTSPETADVFARPATSISARNSQEGGSNKSPLAPER